MGGVVAVGGVAVGLGPAAAHYNLRQLRRATGQL